MVLIQPGLDNGPVSYTHLDVYKRQDQHRYVQQFTDGVDRRAIDRLAARQALVDDAVLDVADETHQKPGDTGDDADGT